MNRLSNLRKKINLTQEELAEKSGISVRTIQRIESGIDPKGHTLKSLVKTLNISEDELLGNDDQQVELNYSFIKIINLSSLPFVILPLANIIVPLIIMLVKKQFNPMTKQIISVQIFWSIVSAIIFFLIAIFEKELFSESSLDLVLIFMVLAVLSNVFIILRNAFEIDKHKRLYIKLKFSFI